jgi:repressor LexA
MLTRKQHELLMFIDKHLRDTGFSPSFEEMKEALNLRSKSGIHRLITALEDRGFLRRRAHRARALEVMRLPEATTPKTKEVAPKPEARPRIYAYTIADSAHQGLLKVGQTTRNVQQRVAEQLKTAAIQNYTIELDVPAGATGTLTSNVNEIMLTELKK